MRAEWGSCPCQAKHFVPQRTVYPWHFIICPVGKSKRWCSALCYAGWWLDSIVTFFSSLSGAGWIRVGKPTPFPLGVELCGNLWTIVRIGFFNEPEAPPQVDP